MGGKQASVKTSPLSAKVPNGRLKTADSHTIPYISLDKIKIIIAFHSRKDVSGELSPGGRGKPGQHSSAASSPPSTGSPTSAIVLVRNQKFLISRPHFFQVFYLFTVDFVIRRL